MDENDDMSTAGRPDGALPRVLVLLSALFFAGAVVAALTWGWFVPSLLASFGFAGLVAAVVAGRHALCGD
ncbi:hypothetical protein [Brachybacterium phenoliresistens]|uniref:Uncharacterized protein n=1 Tax=Brachybacterium phenoliresistens TaxID=396014 RepID=Z9JRN6_9MICO|nr:hypothetical protein [Brachybacterium phenoliresistens]EWS80864.1 hypothetical protein BF93_01810 [Brachybacterium phenoliresistens]